MSILSHSPINASPDKTGYNTFYLLMKIWDSVYIYYLILLLQKAMEGEGVKKWSKLCYIINEWPLPYRYLPQRKTDFTIRTCFNGL